MLNIYSVKPNTPDAPKNFASPGASHAFRGSRVRPARLELNRGIPLWWGRVSRDLNASGHVRACRRRAAPALMGIAFENEYSPPPTQANHAVCLPHGAAPPAFSTFVLVRPPLGRA